MINKLEEIMTRVVVAINEIGAATVSLAVLAVASVSLLLLFLSGRKRQRSQ
jgi:hypothetical protein